MTATETRKPLGIRLGGIRVEQLEKALALIPADTADQDLSDLRKLFKRGIRDYRINEGVHVSTRSHPRWGAMSSEEKFSLCLHARRRVTSDYDTNEAGGWQS